MFDPRWDNDPRERDDQSRDLSRGSRGGSDPRERERTDPRDVFMEQVSLPRGVEREHVHHHGHDYTLRGSETRTLTTVGAFRAVPASDLRDRFDQPLDPRHGELWHLRDSELVQTVRLDRDHTVVTLTKEGRDLLESRRLADDSRDRQAFYAGVPKPREPKHDAELYRAPQLGRNPAQKSHRLASLRDSIFRERLGASRLRSLTLTACAALTRPARSRVIGNYRSDGEISNGDSL